MTQHAAAIGQRWTFVHRDGKRVDYIIEHTESIEPPLGYAAIITIRNVETGGIGYVTWWWMTRPPGDRRGHFEYVGHEQPVAA